MSAVVTKSGAVVHVSLSGEVRVAQAAALYRQLDAALDVDASLVIDAAGVTRLDASVAQIFALASRRARDVRVAGCSVAWAEAWKVLGLSLAPREGAAGRLVDDDAAVVTPR